MPRYWVIAAYDSNDREKFDKVWQFDLTNNLISIGWTDLGDISQLNREQLVQVVTSEWPDKRSSVVAGMLWNFYHEIRVGDVIVARRGQKILEAVGKVTTAAVHTPSRNPHTGHASFLEVSWEPQPRNKVFDLLVFRRNTVTEIDEARYIELLGSSSAGLVEQDEGVSTTTDPEFLLEKYLEEFMVTNFKTIFRGDLRIYDETEENEGQQYQTDNGIIDILSFEQKTNSFVVIELKKGRPSDKVVGQIQSYMGWVKKNLCRQGQGVKGLIVCRTPDPRLSDALEVTQNIDVRYYKVSFELAAPKAASTPG